MGLNAKNRLGGQQQHQPFNVVFWKLLGLLIMLGFQLIVGKIIVNNTTFHWFIYNNTKFWLTLNNNNFGVHFPLAFLISWKPTIVSQLEKKKKKIQIIKNAIKKRQSWDFFNLIEFNFFG